MKYIMVYHWTHKRNLRSILKRGLCPTYSEGKRETLWVCTLKRIAWALGHAAQHHGWDADEMICLAVMVKRDVLKRTALPNVYTTCSTLSLTFNDSVLLHVGQQWVSVSYLLSQDSKFPSGLAKVTLAQWREAAKKMKR